MAELKRFDIPRCEEGDEYCVAREEYCDDGQFLHADKTLPLIATLEAKVAELEGVSGELSMMLRRFIFKCTARGLDWVLVVHAARLLERLGLQGGILKRESEQP